MSAMFNGCSSLSSLDGISNWQTENVTHKKIMITKMNINLLKIIFSKMIIII